MHCETDARLASQPGAGQDMQAVPIYRWALTTTIIVDRSHTHTHTHTTISVAICTWASVTSLFYCSHLFQNRVLAEDIDTNNPTKCIFRRWKASLTATRVVLLLLVVTPIRKMPKALLILNGKLRLSLIHIWRCRRIERCRSRWSPYH